MNDQDLLRARRRVNLAKKDFDLLQRMYHEQHGHWGMICQGGPLRCEDCRCGREKPHPITDVSKLKQSPLRA